MRETRQSLLFYVFPARHKLAQDERKEAIRRYKRIERVANDGTSRE